jgi:hypothetical protein
MSRNRIRRLSASDDFCHMRGPGPRPRVGDEATRGSGDDGIRNGNHVSTDQHDLRGVQQAVSRSGPVWGPVGRDNRICRVTSTVLLTETTAFAGSSASTSWDPPLPRSPAVGEGSMAARINH